MKENHKNFREMLKHHVNVTMHSKEWNVLDKYKDLSIDSLAKIQENSSIPVEVMLLNIEGDLNVGVIVRTSALLGARKVHIVGRVRYDRRSTVGAHNYVKISTLNCFHPVRMTYDYNKIFHYMEQNNLVPLFIEQGGIDLRSSFDLIKNHVISLVSNHNVTPCIVMGNESTGIPEELIHHAKNRFEDKMLKISIPQVGVMRSFNVSSAFSIVFWEISKIFSP